jgi:hypothetical protein
MPQESNQRPDEVHNAAKPGEPEQSSEQAHPPGHEGAAVEPSGPKSENPATAGPGKTTVQSSTPENALGRLNPSAPEDANVTPGSTTVK